MANLTTKIEHGTDAFVVGAIGLLIVGAIVTALGVTTTAGSTINTLLQGLSSAVTTFAAPGFVILAALVVYGAYKSSKRG